MLAQVGVGVAAVGGDFRPQPGRPLERLGFILQFDFRQHQTGVVAKKFIDFLSSKETQTLIATQLNRRSVRKDAPPGEGLMPIASIKLIKGNDEVVGKSKRLWLDKFKDIYTSQ